MKGFRTIAMYLPQYHPIPENDRWWGEGFTDWTNVRRAKGRFRGHHQPHVPIDLGYYDLRDPKARSAQAALAERYGIDAFCYYHYWFNGKLLLERPLNEVLRSGEPRLPFCLCWANENWTRAWDGLDRQILIGQKYTAEDADAHIDWFLRVFEDDRYLRINGAPLLLIYRPDHVPNAAGMLSSWRRAARKAGHAGLELCAVKNGFVNLTDEELIGQGYDSILDFQPNRNDFPRSPDLSSVAYEYARKVLPERLYQPLKLSVSATKRIRYSDLAERLIARQWPSRYIKYPCVFPSWDNTPRRRTPTVIQNDDPRVYERWLKASVESVKRYPPNKQLVFINAWNEWAEGCHLEPDERFGYAFLEATLRAVSRDHHAIQA
jgi:lipopolysaccharide biosynthesis protein